MHGRTGMMSKLFSYPRPLRNYVLATRKMQLPISVGALAAVTTCVVELLIVPLFDLSRNKLSGYIASRELNAGRQIYLYRSNNILTYLGLGSIVRFANIANKLVILTRSSLKLLLIAFVILWESQLKSGYRRGPMSIQLGVNDAMKTTVSLTAPIPLNPVFRKSKSSCQTEWNLHGSTCIGDRVIDTFPRLQLEYVKNCVELQGDVTVVYYAISKRSQSSSSFSVNCLNGKQGTDKKTLMTYLTLEENPIMSKMLITSFNLSNDGNLDPVNRFGPYRVVMKSRHPFENRSGTYDGYFTFAGRTHRDNNVVHSAYGVVVNRDTGTLETISIAITQDNVICSGSVMGEWSIREGEIYCPDGRISFKYPSFLGYHEMNLTKYDLDTQKPVAFTMEDALAWIFETPISLFNSYGGGSQEMTLRYTLMPLFFSFQKRRKLELRTGDIIETTEVHKAFSGLLVGVVAATVVYGVVSSILYFFAVRRSGIHADFDDHNNLLEIWRESSYGPNGRVVSTGKLRCSFLDHASAKVAVWRIFDNKDGSRSFEDDEPRDLPEERR